MGRTGGVATAVVFALLMPLFIWNNLAQDEARLEYYKSELQYCKDSYEEYSIAFGSSSVPAQGFLELTLKWKEHITETMERLQRMRILLYVSMSVGVLSILVTIASKPKT